MIKLPVGMRPMMTGSSRLTSFTEATYLVEANCFKIIIYLALLRVSMVTDFTAFRLAKTCNNVKRININHVNLRGGNIIR